MRTYNILREQWTFRYTRDGELFHQLTWKIVGTVLAFTAAHAMRQARAAGHRNPVVAPVKETRHAQPS